MGTLIKMLGITFSLEQLLINELHTLFEKIVNWLIATKHLVNSPIRERQTFAQLRKYSLGKKITSHTAFEAFKGC